MEYLKNTALIGDYYKRTTEDYSTSTYYIEDYSSMELDIIKDFIAECPNEWFTYAKIYDNDTLERISLKLYGSANYWDLIMLVNDSEPFTISPKNYDVLLSMAQNKAVQYQTQVYGSNLSKEAFDRLVQKYYNDLSKENEEKYNIRVIKPSFIQEFLQTAFEEGVM